MDARERLAEVLERLVRHQLSAGRAFHRAKDISKAADVEMSDAIWTLLETMAAEEKRGIENTLFEGRTQLLTLTAARLRNEVRRHRNGPSWRRSFRRFREDLRWAGPLSVVGLAVGLGWSWLEDNETLTDDQEVALVFAALLVAVLWWPISAVWERFRADR